MRLVFRTGDAAGIRVYMGNRASVPDVYFDIPIAWCGLCSNLQHAYTYDEPTFSVSLCWSIVIFWLANSAV